MRGVRWLVVLLAGGCLVEGLVQLPGLLATTTVWWRQLGRTQPESMPEGLAKDYRFAREVATRLRPEDRLLVFRDLNGAATAPLLGAPTSLLDELPSLWVPVLAGGWFGPTEVAFLEVPEFAAQLRRSPESLAEMVGRATVVMTWRADWQPQHGELLVDWGSRYRAWRLQ